MTIEFAILGLLSWRAFSGYDLKKVFADSAVFYWSGNNNQIYKALVQLHKDGLVSQEIQPQESLPARKMYTITDKGRESLRRWVLSAPELPELRNTFLVQLAWGDLLTNEELDGLLAQYEEEVRSALLIQQAQNSRQGDAPARTPREKYLWEVISQNVVSSYKNELNWAREVRQGLSRF